MPTYKSDTNYRKEAYEIQNACNPRAVARLLVDAIDDACDRNNGTDGAAGDSAVYLIMDKLASLGLYKQSFDMDEISKHYDECRVNSND